MYLDDNLVGRSMPNMDESVIGHLHRAKELSEKIRRPTNNNQEYYNETLIQVWANKKSTQKSLYLTFSRIKSIKSKFWTRFYFLHLLSSSYYIKLFRQRANFMRRLKGRLTICRAGAQNGAITVKNFRP